MKVNEILNEASTKSIDDNVVRLEKVGGKVYTKITKDNETGWLGVNGQGKSKVYFAFYPDGSTQRFESIPRVNDLKPGWKATDLRDPDTIIADKAKTDKIKKEREREFLFTKEIMLDIKELSKLCKENHILSGSIKDAYVDGESERGVKIDSGVRVAFARYTVHAKNDDYTKDGKNGPEIHDPIYLFIWRDPTNPEKYKIKDIT
jgi:hypothetical protein